MFAAFLLFSMLVEAELSPPELKKTTIENLWSSEYEKTTLKDLTGQKIKWLSRKNKKVVVINLWATWCSACVTEMPNFEKLYKKFEKDKDITFMFVTDENEEEINNFLKEKYFYLPICTVDSGKFPITEHHMNVNNGRIPATYIIVPESDEVYIHIGAAQWDDEGVVDFIKKLLKAP